MSSLAKRATAIPRSGNSTRIVAFPAPATLGHRLESGVPCPALNLHPAHLATHQSAAGRGFSAQFIQVTRREPGECEFHASCHLLIAYERGIRSAGDTVVEGLPRSSQEGLGDNPHSQEA